MTTTTKGANPGGMLSELQNALTGVQQDLPSGSALQILNTMTPQTQLEQTLTGYVAVYQAVANEKLAYQKAMVARKTAQPDVRQFLKQLRVALSSLFGTDSPVLTKFGFKVKSTTKPDAQTTMVAVAKRAITRQKRNTMGSKQKLKVKAQGTPQVTLGTNGMTVVPSAQDGNATATIAVASVTPSAAAAAVPVQSTVPAQSGIQTTLTPVVPVASATIVKS